MPIRFEGGDKFEALVRNAGKGGISSVEVGFFSSARYEDGTPVAAVAAANEFGVGVPERPFVRPALAAAKRPVDTIIKNSVDPLQMVIEQNVASRIGEQVRNEIIDAITKFTTPANAPATIAAKKSSHPLIDTGLMRASVTYKVHK